LYTLKPNNCEGVGDHGWGHGLVQIDGYYTTPFPGKYGKKNTAIAKKTVKFEKIDHQFVRVNNKLQELMATKILDIEIKKAKQDGQEYTKEVQFTPCRNLLTEFSGHFSGACWASKYNSIIAEFPNLVSVVITSKGEDGVKKIEGCFLILELKDNNGDNHIMLRGVNPSVDFCTNLNDEVFCRNVLEYGSLIAAKKDAHLSIYYDDHVGGGLSNRYGTYNTFKSILGSKLEQANISNPTYFNGYNEQANGYIVKKKTSTK
jgi:hypothetical protein